MMRIPISSTFKEDDALHPQYCCIVCGKETKNPAGYLRVDEATQSKALPPAYDPDNVFPIGSNCLRKHPELKAWLVAESGEAKQ